MTDTAVLKTWSDYLALMAPAERLLEMAALPHDEQRRAELYRQFAMNFTLGYFMYFGADAEHPDWMPFLNSVLLLQPNPDDTYVLAPLRGDRRYRIVGERGSVHLLTLDIGSSLMGEHETLPSTGKSVQLDLDDIAHDADGRFELLLSATRPAGHQGNWQELHPEARVAMIRQRSYDWGNERDARLAIECLDASGPKPRMPAAQIARNLEALATYTGRLSQLWLTHLEKLRARKPVNEFEFHTFGGGLARQAYWQALFEFAPGEALILETDMPEHHRYWNVQLNDPLFNTLEYVQRQSSLNGHQARLDADGKFRAVLSLEDPGVPNWLDTAGYSNGTLIGRWLDCSTTPMPTLRRVPLADLRTYLPADTPAVSPAERQNVLRLRRLGGQLRRRW
jgi:hypothetical protein